MKRLGQYSSLHTRPVVVEFGYKSDAAYVLQNKKQLRPGVFVEREYGMETSKNRRLLKPIFNAARQMPAYKGKCRMDADVITIHEKEYTKDNLYALPEDLNCFNVMSKSDSSTFAFFGELNALRNFHLSTFEYNGITFHSSEQLIQYMKAIYYEDSDVATAILNSDTALECKQLAKDIKRFNREEWIKIAGEMCDVRIYEKFNQNEELAKLLLSTGTRKIVEASRDRDWGCRLSIGDDRCLALVTWYSQGLLGQILEAIQSKLLENNTKGSNSDESSHMELTTEHDVQYSSNINIT